MCLCAYKCVCMPWLQMLYCLCDLFVREQIHQRRIYHVSCCATAPCVYLSCNACMSLVHLCLSLGNALDSQMSATKMSVPIVTNPVHAEVLCHVLRVYCVLLRPDIEALLGGAQKVVPSEAFFRLLVAVHQLDNLAIQWCGGNIGQLLHPCLTPPPPLSGAYLTPI